MLRITLSFFLFTGLLTACTPTQVVNAFVPALDVQRDLFYGDLERQRLDLYTPKELTQDTLVVFVHGGTWDSGDKADYVFVADSLLQRGFRTALVNYRLVPDITFPSYAEDIALALHWLSENEVALNDVVLMGHSAGAHIAALVAFDESYLAFHGLNAQELAGFVGLAGPYDFLPPAPDALRTRAALGPEENWAATQPINFVEGDEPPALLLTGLADTTVDPGNSRRFAERITELGGSAELVTYEGLDHIAIVGALARVGRVLERNVLDQIVGFLEGLEPLR